MFGLFGFVFKLLVLFERFGELRFEVGGVAGLLLEFLIVAFPAAFPAEAFADDAVDFLLREVFGFASFTSFVVGACCPGSCWPSASV